MPAGITVFNTNNIVQVDETYRNLLLVASGQFTASTANANADLWWTQFQSIWQKLTPQAIMAVRTTTYPGLNLNIGSYRGGLKVCNFSFRRDMADIPFQFYIYDNVPPNSNNFGMQVFNASGQLIYDALDYPLKVIAAVDTELIGLSPTLYAGSNANLAYASSGGGFNFSSDGTTTDEQRAYTYWSGNNLTVNFLQNSRDAGSDNGTHGRPDQSGVIIDISNVPTTYTRS